MTGLTIELLLETLSQEDSDTISLWFIEGYTLKETAVIISKRYLPKGSKPIVARIIGVRIRKIMEKLRENAGRRDLLTATRKKDK